MYFLLCMTVKHDFLSLRKERNIAEGTRQNKLLSMGLREVWRRKFHTKRFKIRTKTTHLHLVPKLRLRGTVPPFSNTSSW